MDHAGAGISSEKYFLLIN